MSGSAPAYNGAIHLRLFISPAHPAFLANLMKHSVVPPLVVVVGLILLLLSFTLPAVRDDARNWTAEKYQEYQDAVHAGHEAMHEIKSASGDPAEDMKKRREEARERQSRLDAELQAAREGPAKLVGVLKWSGVTLIVLGAVAVIGARSHHH